MSRAGYTDDGDDQWAHIMWRGAVSSAIRGKKGQAFLRELRDALDAMPEKRLAAEVLVDEGGNACALGVVALKRGLDTSRIDPEDYNSIHSPFGIANALAREIIWTNDDLPPYHATPEQRWDTVRRWVERNIGTEGSA